MIQAIRQLGATVKWKDKHTVYVKGITNQKISKTIHCQESGLALRLLTCIVALNAQETINLTGEGTLSKRTHKFFEQFLPQMGVTIQTNDGKTPISITGKLRAGTYVIDGQHSSQYVSGLLISFSQIEGITNLIIEKAVSKDYINITIDCLRAFGIKIIERPQEIKYPDKLEYRIYGKQEVIPTEYTVENDWSAASYWLVASALGLDVKVRGLNFQSKQADKAIDKFLTTLHHKCIANENESTYYKPLTYNENDLYYLAQPSITFDATNCPDLIPPLVVYAVLVPQNPHFANNYTKISGIHRLLNKESNRLKTLIEEFSKLGVSIWSEFDSLCVKSCEHIHSDRVNSHNDHRIAMALAIVSILSGVEIEIEGYEAVAKSYPSFWKDVDSLKQKLIL